MPSILNRNPKIPLLHFEIPTVKGGVFSGFWAKRVTCRAHDQISVRIDGINGRMGPKDQKMVVWGAKMYLTLNFNITESNILYN